TDGYDYLDSEGFSRGDVMTSTNPTGGAAAWSEPTRLAEGLFGVACPSAGLCLTTDLGGTVFTATDPQGGASAWASEKIDNVHGLSSVLSGITCPTTTFCAAVDDFGNVFTGTPSGEAAPKEEPQEPPQATGGGTGLGDPPISSSSPSNTSPGPGSSPATISAAQIKGLLTRQLTPAGPAATIRNLLKHGGLTMPFQAPAAGTVTVGWYQVPAGAKLAKRTKAKPVLVASGRLALTSAGTGQLHIKLTAAGKRLLKRAKRLK